MPRTPLRLALALAALTAIAACGDNLAVDPCVATECALPPAPRCDGDTLIVAATATCTADGDVADCQYAETRTACSAAGMVCAAGACHPPGDPCIGQTCNTAPADFCAGSVLTTWDDSGTCDGSSGTATCHYGSHATDCATTHQVCAGGACVDPCTSAVCDSPPSPSCSSTTVAVTYPATGTCDGSTGTPVCSYPPTSTDCALTSRVCSAGACKTPAQVCAATTCDQPPTDDCTLDIHHHYPALGVCDGTSGAPVCVYTPTDIDCTASDDICALGVCVDPCATNPCTSPPTDTCSDSTAEVHPNPGVCTHPGGVVACDYPPTPVDCSATDQACAAGACVDPCIGFACTTPPVDDCTNDTQHHYPASGVCASPGGVPGCAYPPTDTDCTLTNQVCTAGACVDPCIGVTCTTPPPATCTGTGNNTARTFAATGTCTSPAGVVTCGYAPTDQDCALSGQTCAAGACTGPVLFCRVQFPDTITDVPTTVQTVYGRIFVEGVTDQSGVDDPNANVVVELGLGTGADPTAYTYTAATPNASYGPGSPGYEANNDEYQGTFVVPDAAGTVEHYAYRLSNDAGATWMYCDTGNAGSSDGFTQPGTLEIAAPFFSEYVEGTISSGVNRAIEIYNPGSIPFTMTGCQLQIFANGASTSTNANLTSGAVIAAHDVYTFCKTGYALANASACDQFSGAGLWTGNDAVALHCGTTTYDVIGQIGTDPGTEWGTGNTSTLDNTLLRKCTVFAGDTDGSDAFDPADQWQGYDPDSSFLGARNCPLP